MPSFSSSRAKSAILSLFFLLLFNAIQSQNLVIDSIVPPSNAYNCSTNVVTAYLYLGCINYSYSGTSVSVSGNTITIDIAYTFSLQCFGAITYPTHTISLVNLAPGNYTINTSVSYVGVGVVGSVSKSMIVADCCPNAAFQPAFAISDSIICKGDSVVCTNTSAGSLLSYEWFVDGVYEDSTTNFSTLFSTPGVYTITLRVDSGTACLRSTSRNIIVNDFPELELGSNKSFCVGQSATLNAGTGWGSFQWSTNETTQSIVVTDSGRYTLIAQDTAMCGLQYDTVYIAHKSTPMVNLGNDTALCPGATLSLKAGNLGANYLWHDNSTAPVYLVSAAGKYWVKATFSNLCSNTDTIEVTYDGCVGIEQVAQDNRLNVYPNPFTDQIQISLDPNSGPASVTLIDPFGKILGEYTFSGMIHSIDVSDLDSGVYFTVVRLGQEVKTFKLLKLSL
ncbi:MAG: T9SS type A sorting domain-containing protein [Vicingaceae bacterium]